MDLSELSVGVVAYEEGWKAESVNANKGIDLSNGDVPETASPIF